MIKALTMTFALLLLSTQAEAGNAKAKTQVTTCEQDNNGKTTCGGAAYASEELSSRGHRGACDGIHRCICGSTQTRYFGLPRQYNGHNLWMAVEWPRTFPATTPHAGAVMYQHGGGPTGHVSRITSYSGGCTAMVTDERGTYERNICIRGAKFVDVRG